MPATPLSLAAPVTRLPGVGPKLADRLERIGVRIIGDLLFHLPLRYQDRTRLTPIGALRHGDEVVVQGCIDLAQVRFGRRRSLLVRLADGTGAVLLRFFHFNASQQQRLTRGVHLRCYGEVWRGPHGLELVHPEYRPVDPEVPEPVSEALTPVYPLTDGLGQATLRRLTAQALQIATGTPGEVAELLPADLRREAGLPTLIDAIHFIHQPPPDTALDQLSAARHPAQQRLIQDELIAQQLSLKLLRQSLRERQAPRLDGDGRLRQALLATLPFALTGAQRRAVDQIAHDIASPRPMLRLLQGDVGAGKTMVAALTALATIEAGHQAVVMAPTELLAEQHCRNFRRWFEPLGVPVLWLAGRQARAARKTTIEAIAETPAALVIGTHALFQGEVRYARLGLVVIDEQHRFGVDQRLTLAGKGTNACPHQLIMTATPIPRTLAMTAYADLDISVLDEMPPGRLPVTTVVAPEGRRDELVARIGDAVRAGRQAYWVCTLIEESDALQCQAATETAAGLAAALPDARIGLVHGRQKEAERNRAMAAFAAGAIDLLVATTVIEVGVDVPNASLMIVENAERLGLAQLHQLRGRVGRGGTQSDCVLLYRPPLSDLARERLACMRETSDGFRIAERDLELRGPGELLGARQSGDLGFRIADLTRDAYLLPAVTRAAARLLHECPENVEPLVRRWLPDALHYGGA
jgi:ATP-dependent DNA helicase RecG